MLSYLLLTLLFAVSFGDIDCNSIVFINVGSTFAFVTGTVI